MLCSPIAEGHWRVGLVLSLTWVDLVGYVVLFVLCHGIRVSADGSRLFGHAVHPALADAEQYISETADMFIKMHDVVCSSVRLFV
jgi:hypothetical protein